MRLCRDLFLQRAQAGRGKSLVTCVRDVVSVLQALEQFFVVRSP